MPEYTKLRHMRRGKWEYWDYVFDGDPTAVGDTPEAALREALEEAE